MLKDSGTDLLALIIALVALISPIVVELIRQFFDWINERKIEKKELVKNKEKNRKHEFNYIIKYIEIVNRYTEILDKSDEINEEVRHELLELKNNAFKLKSILIASFPKQEYWDKSSFEKGNAKLEYLFDCLLDNSKKSYLINTIEFSQILIEKAYLSEYNYFFELKSILEILPRLLLDFNTTNSSNCDLSEETKRFIKNQQSVYFKQNETTGLLKGIFDFEINKTKDESIEKYYERIFSSLNDKYGDKMIDFISGFSGRLSFSENVPWKNKMMIEIGIKHRKKLFLNCGVTNTEAQYFIGEVLFSIFISSNNLFSNKQTVRENMKNALELLDKEKFSFNELNKISGKTSYFTEYRNKIGNSSSEPLEFKDREDKKWYVDMNLTKDEATTVLKNIFFKKNIYDKNL